MVSESSKSYPKENSGPPPVPIRATTALLRLSTISRTVSSFKTGSSEADRGILSSIVNYTLGDILGYSAPVLTCLISDGSSITLADFQPYINSVQTNWEEYKLSTQVQDSQSLPPVSVDVSARIPSSFFSADYRTTGLADYPVFTKSLRTLCVSHSDSISELSAHIKRIDKVIMRNSPSYMGLIHSLSLTTSLEDAIKGAQSQLSEVSSQLDSAHSDQVTVGLEYLLLSRRKARLSAVLSTVSRMESTLQAMRSIEALVGIGDYSSAEELIGSVRKTLDTELFGMRQCDGLRHTLARFSLMVSKDIEKEFLALVEVGFLNGAKFSETKLKDLASVLLRKGALSECIQTVMIQRLLDAVDRSGVGEVGIDDLFVSTTHRIETFSCIVKVLVGLKDPMLTHPIEQLFEAVCDHLVGCISGIVPAEDKIELLREIYVSARELSIHIDNVWLRLFGHSNPLICSGLVLSVPERVRNLFTNVVESAEPVFDSWNKTVSATIGAELINIFGEENVTVSKRQVIIFQKIYLLIPSLEGVVHVLWDAKYICMHFPMLVEPVLEQLAGLIRDWNIFTRDQLLEGLLSSRTKHPVNATNLAMGCHCVSFLAVGIMAIAQAVCRRYKVDHPMVVGQEGELSEVDDTSGIATLPVNIIPDLTILVQDVKMELNDTRLEILSKLAEILVDRLTAILHEWIWKGNKNQFESVVKDFGQMFSVLSKSLDGENIRRVFGRALSDCADGITTTISRESSNNFPQFFKTQIRTDLLFMYQSLAVHEQLNGLLKHFLASVIDHIDIYLPLGEGDSVGVLANQQLKSVIATSN